MDEATRRGRLALRDTGLRGRGVFTTAPIPAGDVVLTFRGPRLARSEVRDYTHVIQVGTDVFLGPSRGMDDYVNHSCEPNCRLELGDRARLLALRDLPPGTELTFDYSTCMLDEPAIGPCRCGARRCRGAIQPFVDLSPLQRRRLERRGLVPGFVRRAARREQILDALRPARR